MYTEHYARMQVTALTPEWHEKTCNYWYTVTNGAMAHTAFTTKAGLMRWLAERGLRLDGELPQTRGEYATMRVIGEYYATSHGNRHPDETEFTILPMVEDAAWREIKPVVITAAMSNGRYTLALVTEDKNGVRTVHTLNPNVKDRIEVNCGLPGYRAMHELMS